MTSRVFLHIGSFSWEALSALGWCGIVRRRSLQQTKSKPCRRKSKKFHRIVPWNCWWNKPLLNWLVLNPFWGQTFPTTMFLGNKTPISIIAPKNTKDCYLTFEAHPVPFEKNRPVRTSSPAAPGTSFPGKSYERHLGREFRGRLLRLGTELRGLLKPRGWLVGSFRKSQVKEELGIETLISCRSPSQVLHHHLSYLVIFVVSFMSFTIFWIKDLS